MKASTYSVLWNALIDEMQQGTEKITAKRFLGFVRQKVDDCLLEGPENVTDKKLSIWFNNNIKKRKN
jgi:hypothetical protein